MFGGSTENAYLCADKPNVEPMKQERQTEVLSFARRSFWGDVDGAHVVSNGVHHRTYTENECRAHATLHKAIAYLEARGYNIIID